MIKTIETAAEIRVQAAKHRLKPSQTRVVIALGSGILLLAANASAQQLPINDIASAPAIEIGSGWWTPETANSKPTLIW